MAILQDGTTYDPGNDPTPFDQLTPEKQAIRNGGSTVPDTLVSDTSSIQDEVSKLGGDITKGLAEFGITSPDETAIKSTSAEGDIQARRNQLDARLDEDIAKIETDYKNVLEETKLDQEDEMAKAEGRTRIGGFFTQMEAKDILNLQKRHRLELSSLNGQKQQALQLARRAFEDDDYQLARDKYAEAKRVDDEIYNRRRDYFQSVREYTAMNTPLSRANEAVQNVVLSWVQKYPDAFKGYAPSQLLNLTPDAAYKLVLDSKSYQDEVSGANDVLSITEAKALNVPYGTTRKQAMAKGIIPSGGGDDGDFTPTQIAQGAANAGTTIAKFKGYDADTKNFFINTAKSAKDLIDDNIKDGASNEELKDDVEAQPLSQTAKDYLNSYIDSQIEAEEPEQPKADQWWDPFNWF